MRKFVLLLVALCLMIGLTAIAPVEALATDLAVQLNVAWFGNPADISNVSAELLDSGGNSFNPVLTINLNGNAGFDSYTGTHFNVPSGATYCRFNWNPAGRGWVSRPVTVNVNWAGTTIGTAAEMP